jgi:myo-inositol-1(or 4)-monophosphatase
MTAHEASEFAALLDELESLAQQAAEVAGSLLLHDRPELLEVAAKSSPTDVVTQMDRAAEDLIARTILASRPQDAILGEEGGSSAGTSGVRWVIDPLDGTTNYLYDLPLWSVSIAAEIDGRVAVGIVHAPALGVTFRGTQGRGSYERSPRGERALRVSATTDLAHALVSTGFGYNSDQRRRQAEALVEVAPRVRDVRRLGSAAIDLCFVASGRTDAYVESRLHPWDVAAGALIAREAGAVVLGDDDPVDAPYVLACSPGIVDDVMALLPAEQY